MKRFGLKVWHGVKVAVIAFAVVCAIQGNPWVQQNEYRALAQFCGLTPGATVTGVGVCQAVAQVFLGGIQVGGSGFPVTVLCAVSGTTNGASEVDVTPSCSLPTSTASGKILAEVVCVISGSTGPSLAGFIKNATQIGVSPSAAPVANLPFDCFVLGH